MFNCSLCNKTVPTRQPENKIILEVREKTYTNTKYSKINTSYGFEIVKEAKVCPVCYVISTGKKPLVKKENTMQKFDNNIKTSNNKIKYKTKFETKIKRQPEVQVINPLKVET